MDPLEELLEEIAARCRPLTARGDTAGYIPELKKADKGLLGLCAARPGGQVAGAGDWRHRFTLQSIVKVLIFSCCLMDSGPERVLQKVSLEPSGEAFNSIVSLETKNESRPLNPLINAGAIASLTLVGGGSHEGRFERVLGFAREVTGEADLTFNQAVYRSEKRTGARNRALAYFMKSTGVIDGDVEAVLDAYFRMCAIEVDCAGLARMGLVYALDGLCPQSGRQLIPKPYARMVKAVMTLCGMYNESGRVAVQVGLPAKSGVGGGIMAAAPGKLGIGVFGPSLNAVGSSVAGLEALAQLSRALDLNIF